MKKQVKITLLDKFLWSIASIIEWITIPLFILAMGVNIDIEIYNKIKEWKYISVLFYSTSAAASTIFLYFIFKFKKMKLKRELLIAELSCLLQIILIIIKYKI